MTDTPNVPNPKHVNALLQDALEWLLENRPELLTPGDADPVEALLDFSDQQSAVSLEAVG